MLLSNVFFYDEKGEDGRDLKLAGNVGFVSLPDQLVNKRVDRGFYFNILCVGKSYEMNMFNFIMEITVGI